RSILPGPEDVMRYGVCADREACQNPLRQRARSGDVDRELLRQPDRRFRRTRTTRFWRRACLRPQRMPAGGPPGQVPIRALTCVDRDWLPGRGVHRRIISNGLGERGLALDQDALGAAGRTVPPCVQGECYPRISPYPPELLPDAYRAVHHGERVPRAVAD